tara:strand:+ start:151 stop:1362 length:1212 start_codon:yes stop_codon:yes gene_type:complete
MMSCGKHRQEELALVNGHEIGLNDFLPKYRNFLSKTHQNDNLSNRYAFLNSMIDESIILEYAKRSGFNNSPEILHKKAQIHDQLLLNEYYDKKVINGIQITDNELRQLFKYFNTRLHVRHLYAPDLETIQDISNKIDSGISWEYLAKTCFEDSILKNNGGDIGWYKMGELDPAFEITAYELLDGEISEPTKTRDGFSLIQVLEREKDVFLTEQDYQLNKDWLKQMAVRYKRLPFLRKFTDDILKDLAIQFDENGLNYLLEGLSNSKENLVLHSDAKVLKLKNKKQLSVDDCMKNISKLSDKQFKRIRSTETLKSILSGIFVRNEILANAKDLHLDRSKYFRDTFKQEYTSLILRETVGKTDRSTGVNWQEEYFQFRDKIALNNDIMIDSVNVRSFPMVFKATI